MNIIEGAIRVDYLNVDGSIVGSQNGLIMSYYDQTVIFTPFNINKDHFSHLKNAVCVFKDKIIEMNESRLSHPFLIRIWNIPSNGINPSSEITINFPKRNHYLNNIKLDIVNDININFWHITLPSLYAHEINIVTELGSVIHYNNKVTGMIVSVLNNKSIIINTYTLKQLINGQDYNYANLYYGLSKTPNNEFYVKEDWEQYENCLVRNDIILEIENIPISMYMYFEKFNKDIYIDSWITSMYMEKDTHELRFKILRDNKELYINVPRKPFYYQMQIPYYSNEDEQVSFEKIHMNKDRFAKIGYDLQKNPKQIFV